MGSGEGFTMRNFIAGRSAFKILTGKPKYEIWPLGLKEIGAKTRNYMDLAQDRDYWRGLLSAALNIQVP